ncbi:MAG: hypothetical protein NG784_15695 [Candidatus Jettenia sp.]|nr:hypothetical protein [Candidatus Jettenia sp.]
MWGYRTQEEIEEDLSRTADEFNFANNQIGNIDNLIKLINESNKGWVENEVKRIELETSSHYIWMRMLRGLGGVFESEAMSSTGSVKYFV